MSDDDIESTTREAEEYLEDEEDRGPSEPREIKKRKREDNMTDTDLVFLRKKFPFLSELSDRFIRSQTTAELLKMETTTLKMRMMEQSRDCEDRLASNKMALEEKESMVPRGTDNRWNKLHPGRFLGGATCPAKRLWLEARKVYGLNGEKPVGSYDMGAVGMGGFVTSKGWVELHNPSSTKISLKLFSINNCAARSSSTKASKGEDEVDDIVELGEFKLALRTLRVATAMVMPWNMSVVALENFLFQTDFCRADLSGLDSQGKILTQFADYVLRENSNRWRDGSGFLDTGSMKGTWDAFFGARPQSHLPKSKKPHQNNKSSSLPPRKWVDICFAWNIGKCLKPDGTCKTNKGTALRHVCNYKADMSKDVYCEKNHARSAFH